MESVKFGAKTKPISRLIIRSISNNDIPLTFSLSHIFRWGKSDRQKNRNLRCPKGNFLSINPVQCSSRLMWTLLNLRSQTTWKTFMVGTWLIKIVQTALTYSFLKSVSIKNNFCFWNTFSENTWSFARRNGAIREWWNWGRNMQWNRQLWSLSPNEDWSRCEVYVLWTERMRRLQARVCTLRQDVLSFVFGCQVSCC